MTDTAQNNKRIAKNTLFLYFRQLLTMTVAIYTSRIVLKTLGVVDYGIYNVVGGMVAMFSFLNFSLAQATQRFIAFGIGRESLEQQRNTFSMLINVHIIIALILLVLCESIGIWLFYNKLVIPDNRLDSAFWVMQCSIVTLMVTVTQVPYNASIFCHEKMNVYAYISILEVLLKLIIVFLIEYLFIDKLLYYGILVMCVQVIIATTYRIYCFRYFDNCRYHFYWSKHIFKNVFSFSSWSVLGNLAFTLNNQGMNFLINIFFGPAYNAARGISNSVSSAVTSFATNFLGATIPQIIKTYASGDFSYCIKLNHESSKLGFFLFMLVSLPLISIINPILSIWLVEIPPQTNIFCALSLLYIQATTMQGTLQNVAQATGKVKKFQLSHGLFSLMAVPIVYLLYKNGAEINTYLYVLIIMAVSSVFIQLWAVKSVFIEYSIITFLKNVTLREIIVFTVPAIISSISYNMNHTLKSSILCFLLTFIVSILSIWFLGLTENEKSWLKRIIKSKISRK